jgi:beta-xylosidase
LIHREEKSHLVATGGLYAPTIRHHNGTFYVVCTNVVHQSLDGSNNELQNFIVSTSDIYASKWSDPVYFDFYGIDPSLFFDTDGKAYLCGSKSPGPETKIMLFEINVETGEKLTEEKELWHGTGGIYPEGPHIYLRNDFYYLMVAEGGTHEGHSVTMARSKSIWGPYEPSPLNPILSAAGTDEYVQATGHCEAFEDKNGEWWGLGRETFLTKAKWSEDGWLRFDRAKLHVDGFEDIKENARLTAASSTDLLYIHDPELSCYKISDRVITLTASPHDLSSPEASPTFIGKRQRRLEGKSSVTLLNPAQADSASSHVASLAVYKDEHRWLRISYASSTTTVRLQVLNKAQGIGRTIEQKVDGKFKKLQFVLEYTEMAYTASYGVDDGKLQKLGNVETIELSDKDFVGPIIGMCAVVENAPEQISFEDFVVDSA